MIDCDCAGDVVLETVVPDECQDPFGKDARFIFQKLDDANNLFVNGTNGIEEESSWDGLADATDNTKIVVTPILEDVEFASAAVLEDSENLDGAPNAVGPGPQLVTAMIRNPTSAQFDALSSLSCQKGVLTLYRLNNNGKIGARGVGADRAGIKISRNTFIVLPPIKGTTRADQEKLPIQFYLPADWYKTFVVVTPEDGFDTLNEIKPS